MGTVGITGVVRVRAIIIGVNTGLKGVVTIIVVTATVVATTPVMRDVTLGVDVVFVGVIEYMRVIMGMRFIEIQELVMVATPGLED